MTSRFVLWDLDGTLIDSGGDIAASANAARVELGFAPLADETIRGFVGEGAGRLMEQVMGPGAPETLQNKAFELFFEHYRENLLVRTRPYSGIDRLVRALEGRQGIATNKLGGLSKRIVTGCGWDSLFRCVVGGDDVPRRKPAPDMVVRALELAGVTREEAVFIGDSSIDVRTAAAAGIDFIAVSWGLRPRHELLDSKVIVDSVPELEEALLRLGGAAC